MNKIQIFDRQVEYTVEYRNVKYLRLQIIQGNLKIIAPYNSKLNLEDYILNNKKWIYKKLLAFDKYNKEYHDKTINKSLVDRSDSEFNELIQFYINKYQKLLDVSINRLQIRNMTKKWGSCSSKSNITLSKDLIYLPENLIAYVIYHEIAHLIELNHNKSFFNLIKKEFDNYAYYDDLLNQYAYLINKKKDKIQTLS